VGVSLASVVAGQPPAQTEEGTVERVSQLWSRWKNLSGSLQGEAQQLHSSLSQTLHLLPREERNLWAPRTLRRGLLLSLDK